MMDNVQFVKSLYAAFMQGDLETIFAALDPGVEWFANPDPALIPWGGERHGIAGAKEFFSELAAHADIEVFEPRQFFAGPDSVTVRLHVVMHLKPSGQRSEGEWVHLFTIRDGKVTALRIYGDTHALVQAYYGGDIHSAATTAAEATARLHH